MSVQLQRQQLQLGKYWIHSIQAGSAGPAVVLLHGLAGSWRWWRYSIPELARHFVVSAPELIGFGRSRPALVPFSIQELAGVVREWLLLTHLPPVRLVGHSMGAQIAIHLAAQSPELIDRLVLVSASGVPRHITPRELARFVSELIPPRAWGAPLFLPKIAVDALRAGPRALLHATRGLLTDDITPQLSRIRAPTLVVWGENDPLTPLQHGERIAGAIAGAKLLVLKRASHNPMVDRPAEFNRALIDFLS